MKRQNRIFSLANQSHGNMLVELLLSVALAAVIIPFIFKYQQNAVTRAQNIAITRQMSDIQSALERYIVANREDLLRSVGRNITRVSMADLAPFGVPESALESGDEKYQLRVLKSSDYGDQSSLQGVIVRVSDDITPLRTREIVKLSGGSMGFVDGKHAYGTFGAWHTDSVDLGVDIENGIIETTSVNRDNALYLSRLPSDKPEDARMMTALNLGGHDVKNSSFVNSGHAEFTEFLTVPNIVAQDLIFQNRTTVNWPFEASTAVVSGMLASDAKNMEIAGSFNLADVGKFASITTDNLWVSKLSLSGLSINEDAGYAGLDVTQGVDMTGGRISAMYVTVGFTGSITPRLVIRNRLSDPSNPGYYWDMSSGTANFADATFKELNRMATLATYYYGNSGTVSGQTFGAVSVNKNATVADFMNAISEIQERVRTKYSQLKF